MVATLESKKELCQGTWEFSFRLSEKMSFRPGEYIFLTVQNLVKPDDRGPRRHFSILSTPGEDLLKISTRIRDTGFKQTLHALPIGGEVDISKPYGDLLLPEDKNLPVVMIAGGIGITPFMSMLTSIKQENISTPVTLLYSNKTVETTPYFDELKSLDESMPNFNAVFFMTQDDQWGGEKGRIDASKIKQYVTDLERSIFYVVGPGAMNQAIEDLLVELQVPQDNIKREDFTGY